ncbi:hypothetical protein MRQ36_05630 [Micromonospora sp. R77]|uniref:hypothetical protein n=1 Tax=Micromonospora sp. R77 TaxID=2925836 RepID=UPI001F6189B5|nr:hypothetical protein [Micromonospora sp. R77]MCI4062072.1 hypothetical protein [Micromonospora sp. R77]
MRDRVWQVAMLLLGAVLLGTVGLSVGSWYGGRGAAPMSYEQAQRAATELLPAARPNGSVDVHAFRYGVFLAADDFGSRYTQFHYGDRADCTLSDQLRRNAEARGWPGRRGEPGDPCDGRRVEVDGLLVTLTHRPTGSTLHVTPAPPDGFLTITLTGTLLGAAAGAGLLWLAARRRPPVPRLVGTLVTVALLPGAALTWTDLATNGLVEPVWPIWRSFLLLAPLCLVLLLTGLLVLTRRRQPTDSATDETAVAAAPGPSARSSG